ncbi:hypothetical protein BDW72DRAFT_146516 [Aspergillus terricola var. indicus]
MSWSIEEVVSFITMLFAVPTFILALWGILNCHRRSRNRRPASETSNDILPLFRIDDTPLLSISALASPVDIPFDLEAGWIAFNHITTSTISRSGSFRVDQRSRA